MRLVLLFSILLITSCASKPAGHYVQSGNPKTNVDEALNDCRVKAKVVIGDPESVFDVWFGHNSRKKEFMDQCMSGQGYSWIDG